MSFSASDPLALAGLGAAPASTAAEIPASVRRQGTTATAAYAEGLAFEQVLTNQLAQQLAGTISGSAAGAYSSLIPQALSQSLQSGGGVGIASEIAQAIDPSIGTPRRAS